jgi:hypothetical protein
VPIILDFLMYLKEMKVWNLNLSMIWNWNKKMKSKEKEKKRETHPLTWAEMHPAPNSSTLRLRPRAPRRWPVGPPRQPLPLSRSRPAPLRLSGGPRRSDPSSSRQQPRRLKQPLALACSMPSGDLRAHVAGRSNYRPWSPVPVSFPPRCRT